MKATRKVTKKAVRGLKELYHHNFGHLIESTVDGFNEVICLVDEEMIKYDLMYTSLKLTELMSYIRTSTYQIKDSLSIVLLGELSSVSSEFESNVDYSNLYKETFYKFFVSDNAYCFVNGIPSKNYICIVFYIDGCKKDYIMDKKELYKLYKAVYKVSKLID